MKSKTVFKLLVVVLALFLSAFFLLGYMSEIDFLKLKSLHLSASADEISVLKNSGVDRIAIIDTGYRYDSGFDECQIVDQYNVLDGSVNVDDSCGHGSAMLATLLGYNNSEEEIYIDGINPNAEVVVIKVAESSRTSAEALALGIHYAIDAGVNLINISMGTSVNNSELEEAVNEALSCGIQIVAAVGDTNDSEALYPARYDGVIAVEAQATDGTRYLYSNECDKSVRIPGVNVTTIGYNVATEEWQQEFVSGSSMASIIFSSVLTREDYEVDYDYLEDCKLNDIPVTFELSDCTIPIETEEDGECYDLLKEEQETISSLDHEFMVQYGDYVCIEGGKYQFYSDDFTEDDEGAEFISYNIDTINELIDEDAAYIDEETYDVVLTCDEDVLAQAGANKIKFHWYGIDLTMDESLTILIATLSLFFQCYSKNLAKSFIANAIIDSGELPVAIDKITEQTKVFFREETLSKFGNSFIRSIINKWGSIDACAIVLESILSTIYFVASSLLTVIHVATSGVSIVFYAVINYVLSIYVPSILSCIVVSLGLIANYYNAGKMSIRWVWGWGTTLSGVK